MRLRRYRPRKVRDTEALGDLASDLTTAADIAKVAAEIIRDPALPEIVQSVDRLHQLEVQSGAPDGGAGIGLRNVVTPLQYYVKYRENPILIGALAVAIVVGIPMFIGYTLGKK